MFGNLVTSERSQLLRHLFKATEMVNSDIRFKPLIFLTSLAESLTQFIFGFHDPVQYLLHTNCSTNGSCIAK